jgi:hypothetical protein
MISWENRGLHDAVHTLREPAHPARFFLQASFIPAGFNAR